MAWFRRTKVPRDDASALRTWMSTRSGVEAYVEPRTSVSPTTVVLVADDGEFMRRSVSSPEAAEKFARAAGIPVYDTNRVGLPKRMRDYALRTQAGTASTSAPASPGRSQREIDALATLARAASKPVPAPDVSTDDLKTLVRAARAAAHPDRNGGSRASWDAVEEAARTLGFG